MLQSARCVCEPHPPALHNTPAHTHSLSHTHNTQVGDNEKKEVTIRTGFHEIKGNMLIMEYNTSVLRMKT